MIHLLKKTALITFCGVLLPFPSFASTDCSSFEDRILQEQRTARDLEIENRTLLNQIERQEEHIQDLEETYDDLLSKQKDLNKDYTDTLSDLNTAKKEIISLQTSNDNLQKEIEQLNRSYTALQEKIEKTESKKSKSSQKRSQR